MADQLAGQATAQAVGATAAPPDLSSLFGVSPSEWIVPIPGEPAQVDSPPGRHQVMAPGGAATTVGDALESFYGLTPDQVTALQQTLYGTPFWTSSKQPVAGDVHDPNTFEAYKNAVIVAARQGVPLNDVLNNVGTGEAGLGTPSPPSPPTTRVYPGGKVAIHQTDPETIRLAANATAQHLLGRDLSDKEAQGVVDAVRSDEAKKGGQQAALDESQRQAQIQTNEALYGGGPGGAGGGGAAGPTGTGGPALGALPAQYAQALQELSASGQLAGLDPNILAAVAMAESSGKGGAVNSAGYGGFFGLAPDRSYPGGQSVPRSAMTGTDTQSFKQQAVTAAAEFASLLKQFNGNVLLAETAYQEGPNGPNARRGKPAGEGVNVFQSYGVTGAALAAAGVATQGVTPAGPTGAATDVFLPPTLQDVSTPVSPQGAATQQIQTQNVPEMQEYALQTQIQNFTAALHGVPGDTGASKGTKV